MANKKDKKKESIAKYRWLKWSKQGEFIKTKKEDYRSLDTFPLSCEVGWNDERLVLALRGWR